MTTEIKEVSGQIEFDICGAYSKEKKKSKVNDLFVLIKNIFLGILIFIIIKY